MRERWIGHFKMNRNVVFYLGKFNKLAQIIVGKGLCYMKVAYRMQPIDYVTNYVTYIATTGQPGVMQSMSA